MDESFWKLYGELEVDGQLDVCSLLFSQELTTPVLW
jgi:hypothetical protein